MSGKVAALYRHPVKSLGEERLEAVALGAGRHMPWDRVWAVLHGGGRFDAERPQWVGARNFVTQTFVPNLSRIVMRFDETTGKLSLDHPQADPISVNPDTEGEALCDWLLPLAGAIRPGPYRVARLPDAALTDFPDAHLALNSMSSLAALEDAAGGALARGRFRGNVWIDGFAPWEEFDWVGREITVGEARLAVTDRIQRCNATSANPATGLRDSNPSNLLKRRWGHMDFGVYARVVKGGAVRSGDPVETG